MKIKYYEDADLLSLRLSKKPYFQAAQNGDVIVHYSKDREPVLIEILNAASFLREADKSLPKRIHKSILAQSTSEAILHRIK